MASASTAPCDATRKTIAATDRTRIPARKSATTTWCRAAIRLKVQTTRASTGRWPTASGPWKGRWASPSFCSLPNSTRNALSTRYRSWPAVGRKTLQSRWQPCPASRTWPSSFSPPHPISWSSDSARTPPSRRTDSALRGRRRNSLVASNSKPCPRAKSSHRPATRRPIRAAWNASTSFRRRWAKWWRWSLKISTWSRAKTMSSSATGRKLTQRSWPSWRAKPRICPATCSRPPRPCTCTSTRIWLAKGIPVPLFALMRSPAGGGQRDTGLARLRHGRRFPLPKQPGMRLSIESPGRVAHFTPIRRLPGGRVGQRPALRRGQQQRRPAPSGRRFPRENGAQNGHILRPQRQFTRPVQVGRSEERARMEGRLLGRLPGSIRRRDGHLVQQPAHLW